MQRIVILSLCSLVLMAGQDTVVNKDFKTTEAHYRLGDYEIIIRQQKRLKEISGQKEFDTRVGPVYCSASIEIKQNTKVIDRLDFDDIHPLGWHYGIHLPFKQESTKHFILVKYGDYDCRTLVMTDEGKLFNLGGGSYRIFLGRYLISPRELADSPWNITIFDLFANKILFTLDWGDPKWPVQAPPDEGRAQMIKLYTNGADLFASIDIVNMEDSKIVTHTGSFYKIDLEKGKIGNAVVFDEKTHKEFIIDYSNIDMNADCECKDEIKLF